MEWSEIMRKHVLIEVVLALIILGVSSWNIKQQQESVSLKETVSTLKEEQKVSKKSTQRLISENERLSYEVAESLKLLKKTRQTNNISGTNLDLNSEFINVVTKLFSANLNFTPENYDDKKKEVSRYLSEDLNREYFGQKRITYNDANGTTSMLESLEVYPKGVQDNELMGLIIIHYKSQQSRQDWKKETNIFKIKYDSGIKKVTEILNLGNGYHSKKE